MIHIHYNLITNWLHVHPHWGGIAAFVIAFAESVAIIGSIVPGTITMTAIGVLLGSGVLPIWTTIIWAIAGAFFGDGLSYMIGYHFKDGIRRLWPFSRFPIVIIKGEAFFFKHGGKSIFIGRFVGPVRAIIPIIAGMLNLPPKRYFVISIISAISWAPIYMLPGILLGTISLEMPADVAAELVVFILLLLVVFWFVIWVIKKVYQKTHNFFAILLDREWRQWLQQPSKKWICNLLRRGDRPYSHGQLFAVSIMLLAVIFFGVTFLHIFTHGVAIPWNITVYHLFRGIHTPTLNKLMVVVSSFAYAYMLLPVILIMFLWLIVRRQWLVAIHWVLGFLFTYGAIFILKYIYFSQRPPGILHSPASSSFPSGHVTVAIVIYGMLAFFFARGFSKDARKIIYAITAIFCIFISIARLYLGVHWLTDIMGAIFLGSAILSFIVISYRRYKPVVLSTTGLLITAILAIAICNGYFLHKNYAKRLRDFQNYWPTTLVAERAWWQRKLSPAIPLYRTNRFGKPVSFLNLQWAGNLQSIRATLKLHGWQDFHVSNYFEAIKQLLEQTDFAKHRPLLAKLYKDQHPVLEMIRYSDAHDPPLIIRLWRANVRLMPDDVDVWVGTVDYDILFKNFFFFYHKKAIIPATQRPSVLIEALTSYIWEIKIVKPRELPKELRGRYPVFRLLLIKPNWSLSSFQ